MIIKNKNKLFILSIIITLLIPLFQINIYGAQSYPYIAGKSGLAMEYYTETIVYEKNMNETIFPASTTKMLTALIAIDRLKLDTIITAPPDFPKAGGTSINIVPGEEFTVEQLLNATLIRSANDAALLLAIGVSTTVDEFVVLMNQVARELGCTNSNFVNPNGLHDNNHYSTAYDMSRIAVAFLKNSILSEIVATPEYKLPATNKKAERALVNTNKFLTGGNFQIENNGVNIPVLYDVVDGIKTGTTPEAGSCLVATAPKDNLRIISLVFGSNEASIYADSRYLLDYGLDNYKRTEVIQANSVIKTLKKPFAEPSSVELKIDAGYSYIEPLTESAKIVGTAVLDRIKMPLTARQQVGVYKIENKDTRQIIKELPIYAATSYESKLSWNYLGKSTFGKIFRILLLLIIISTAGFAVFMGKRQYDLKKIKKIRQQKRQREKKQNGKNNY